MKKICDVIHSLGSTIYPQLEATKHQEETHTMKRIRSKYKEYKIHCFFIDNLLSSQLIAKVNEDSFR